MSPPDNRREASRIDISKEVKPSLRRSRSPRRERENSDTRYRNNWNRSHSPAYRDKRKEDRSSSWSSKGGGNHKGWLQHQAGFDDRRSREKKDTHNEEKKEVVKAAIQNKDLYLELTYKKEQSTSPAKKSEYNGVKASNKLKSLSPPSSSSTDSTKGGSSSTEGSKKKLDQSGSKSKTAVKISKKEKKKAKKEKKKKKKLAKKLAKAEEKKKRMALKLKTGAGNKVPPSSIKSSKTPVPVSSSLQVDSKLMKQGQAGESMSRKLMAPMTKEEWEKRQSVIRREVSPTTGRIRVIKGDGEILEEIVSKDRHKQINKSATTADGESFQQALRHGQKRL